MSLNTDIARLLDADALTDAVDAARAHIKTTPADRAARSLYIDLLILTVDYAKADAQCALAQALAPEDAFGFTALRQALRAMEARQAWFESGAVPDFPGGPSPLDELALRSAVALRGGDVTAAADAIAEIDELRGEVAMTLNGRPVADIRDLDDRTPHALEVLTGAGRYLWVDFRRIASLTVAPIARPRDLAFREAKVTLVDGANASVLLPATYHGGSEEAIYRLGRQTDWIDAHAPLVTGIGQRCFLAADELMPFHDMTSLAAGAEMRMDAGQAVNG